MNFLDLERASFHHPIYDADPTNNNPLWYRESLNTGYEFRLGPREPDKPQPSCRFDQDLSGDYDPSAKKVRQVLPIQRKRALVYPSQPAHGSDESVPRKVRPMSWQNGRFNGLSLPITLKLDSERGRELLAQGTDHWPLDDQSSSSSSQDPTFWSHSASSSSSSLQVYDQEPYAFRHREGARKARRNRIDTDEEDIDISNITIGHPAARGCIPCLKLRLPCTLLEEGANYPCQDCIEDDYDCELVIEPLMKRSCQGCRRRRIRCSYLDPESDHSRACRICSSIGVKCVAGPASGCTRTGPSLDQAFHDADSNTITNPTSQVENSRSFVTCSQCRQVKKRCSLRKGQEGPCNRCKANSASCTFEALPNSRIKDRVRPKNKETQSQVLTPSPVDGQQGPTTHDTSNPSLPSKTITTRLPNPILFNHEPASSCSWCIDPLHGLLGFGTVHPLVHDTSSGYMEIRGGHTSQGHLPSRMCVSCTLDRFSILACEQHELRALPGTVDPRTLDLVTVMHFLVPGMAERAEWDWCCVCPSPASYGCCRPHEEGMGDERMGNESGCGLRLCEECAVALVAECRDDLEELVKKKTKEGKEDEFAVRADAEFLTRGGELLTRVGVVVEEQEQEEHEEGSG
ncbi:MAG: hypothetical protein Q9196_005906 [Gyalolechia fulgens]